MPSRCRRRRRPGYPERPISCIDDTRYAAHSRTGVPSMLMHNPLTAGSSAMKAVVFVNGCETMFASPAVTSSDNKYGLNAVIVDVKSNVGCVAIYRTTPTPLFLPNPSTG
jgi:hypothetical protein